MVGDVIQFLQNLGEDPDALAQFQADPAAAIDAAGLPDEAKEAILSFDPKQIRDYLAGELQNISNSFGLPVFHFIIFCIIIPPHSNPEP